MVAKDRGWVKWRGEREGLARAQGSCWGHGYVYSFCDDGFPSTHTWQKVTNCTLKYIHFMSIISQYVC